MQFRGIDRKQNQCVCWVTKIEWLEEILDVFKLKA